MKDIQTLRPVDIPVALYLALQPNAQYASLAHDLHISGSTAHDAVRRLMLSGLVRQTAWAGKTVNVSALLEFLEHGVRYAFPAQRQRRQRGVPTAHAAPALLDELDASVDPVVWASVRGSVIGASVNPLIPKADELPERCPKVYDLLTLVDALRLGTTRDREVASRKLTERLAAAAA